MPLTAQEKQILATCYSSREAQAKILFPERFVRPFDPLHRQIFRALSSTAQVVIIAAPRGTGKTSTVNLNEASRAILFAEANYIVPVSASHSLAQQQSENLKRELTGNPLIRSLFGDVSTKAFSKEQWVVNIAGKEICIMPRGAGQQIRGLLFKNHRPDRILVDDLEDPEKVDSVEGRAKTKEWFFADLMNCVDRGSKDWRIYVVGTILHEQSLLQELLDMAETMPNWYGVRLEICDDDLKSNAPNFISDDEVKALYDSYVDLGKVDTFYREYRNIAAPTGQDAAFQAEHFRYYQEGKENLGNDPDVWNVLLYDPARTAKPNSAETGLVVVGLNLKNHKIFVREAFGAKLHADEQYAKIVQLIHQYNVRTVGVEVTGLHEFILHPLKNALARHGLFGIDVMELHSRGGSKIIGVGGNASEKAKVARVRSLIPYYRQGLVLHNQNATARLEAQLLGFPRSKYWDLMDPLGYVPEILEERGGYMRGYRGTKEDLTAVEAEYDRLTAWAEDVPDLGDWRSY